MIGESHYCAMTWWPCLTQGDWVAVWSGIIGAAAAFALSTLYQSIRRNGERRDARRNIRAAIAALRSVFRVNSSDLDAEHASRAVVKGRAAFSWANGHPEYFNFDEWSAIHEMREIIEIWFEDNSRLSGFRNSVYMGQGPKNTLWTLGRNLEYFLDIDI